MGKLSDLTQRLSRATSSFQIMKYPPELSEEQAASMISDIKDWQLTHGSLLKLVQTDEEHTVLAHPVGVAVFPTLFPRHLYDEAIELQNVYNKLYTAVAEDEQWLYSVLKDLIELDKLTRCLWEIYEEGRKEGYIQDLSLGVWRNDYMLGVTGTDEPVLKQVEFNTIAVAGGTHGNRISEMHQQLQKSGAYQLLPEEQKTSVRIEASSMPENHTIDTITKGLMAAHQAYGPPKYAGVENKCVLFIVQPRNFNIADERPLEHGLWANTPPIPAYRLEFGPNVLEHTTLTSSRELLYHPPSRPGLNLEVSIIYFRSAFETHEFNNVGRMARLHLERSRAIKCPNLLGHLCTLKRVQQALAMPGSLERFLEPDEVVRVRETFAPMFVLDSSKRGLQIRKVALDPEKAQNYVLKPSLEGGGHNVYGSAIPEFLRGIKEELWGTYVLQEKIVPPRLRNVLMSRRGIFQGDVISELGIFGVCLWRRKSGVKGEQKAELVEEMRPSWSFKTKDAAVDEMSVVKGFGCFDSPLLVEKEVFASYTGASRQEQKLESCNLETWTER